MHFTDDRGCSKFKICQFYVKKQRKALENNHKMDCILNILLWKSTAWMKTAKKSCCSIGVDTIWVSGIIEVLVIFHNYGFSWLKHLNYCVFNLLPYGDFGPQSSLGFPQVPSDSDYFHSVPHIYILYIVYFTLKSEMILYFYRRNMSWMSSSWTHFLGIHIFLEKNHEFKIKCRGFEQRLTANTLLWWWVSC